jgi:hypothetical protein
MTARYDGALWLLVPNRKNSDISVTLWKVVVNKFLNILLNIWISRTGEVRFLQPAKFLVTARWQPVRLCMDFACTL